MLNRTDTVDDGLLVERIRQNDKDAFRILYNRYSRKIYCFSLKHLGSEAEAEELVQSVFIRIWEKRELLDPAWPVKSYIYRSAVNYIYNFLKKKTIHNRYVEAQAASGILQSDPTYEQIFFNDLENSINSILNVLPEQQQRIFQLSRNGGLSNREIARKLGISVRTVENQIYRAVKTIKAALKSIYFRI
jgi:RNA polymerase sigma-70 factor (ECF subfamily)